MGFRDTIKRNAGRALALTILGASLAGCVAYDPYYAPAPAYYGGGYYAGGGGGYYARPHYRPAPRYYGGYYGPRGHW